MLDRFIASFIAGVSYEPASPPVESACRSGGVTARNAVEIITAVNTGNKSERAVGAMTDDEFDSRVPNEEAWTGLGPALK
jgi:hypothetical protein